MLKIVVTPPPPPYELHKVGEFPFAAHVVVVAHTAGGAGDFRLCGQHYSMIN